MADSRKHRGPHPDDAELFAPAFWTNLRTAVDHLSWLLSRGYAQRSSLKIVGDRFALSARQRLAVMRSACSDEDHAARSTRQIGIEQIRGRPLVLDGFNVLTTVEAALAGGVILHARDGCFRDMASMHGNYRKVAETRPALEEIGDVLAEFAAGPCRWLFDSPVTNSGRLRALLLDLASERGWNWQADLAADPDRELIASPEIVATADSVVIGRCNGWLNLAREVVDRRIPGAAVVPLDD